MNDFFTSTFDFDKEKKKFIDYMDLKKSQDIFEFEFYKKYYEIQDSIKDRWYVSNLKKKLWNGNDILNFKPLIVSVGDDKELLKEWRYLIRFTSTFKNVSNPGRNMKFLVVDEVTGKYIGALTVSSDFGSLKSRDDYIGWTNEDKYSNRKLQNTANAQSIIPIQPFGYNFLGGKLMSLMITSKKIRDSWEEAYGDKLVGMTTTALYGPYSQYTNLPNLKKMGSTKGQTFIKPPSELVNVWIDYFKETKNERYMELVEKVNSNPPSKKYHKQNVLSLIMKTLELKPKDYEHGFKRGVYFCSFYENTSEFLKSEISEDKLIMKDKFKQDMDYIVSWWKPKAINRFNKLKLENRLKSDIHFWDKLFDLSYEEALKYMNKK